jgi:arabinofuranosyltransferase
MDISKNARNILLVLLIVVSGVVLYRNAWLSDDAYITFRTVDNFINGYGLTWNIVERVQTYTHPLWMFFLSFFYFLTREIYFTSIFLSMAVSLVFVVLLTRIIATDTREALLGVLLLISSKAFVDYSSSGLENPLTHLLLLLFFWSYLDKRSSPGNLLFLFLTASMCMLNRMDTVLLILPALVYEFFTVERNLSKKVAAAILGLSPFIFWEAFSLFYYGFLFPNTAYAKLNTGIPQADYLVQGFFYLIESTKLDYLTLPAILIAIAVVILKNNKKLLFTAIGVVLYILYIIKIGGDFMSGRFLTAPFVCSVIILLRSGLLTSRKLLFYPAIAVIVVVGLVSPAPPVFSNEDFGKEPPTSLHGVTDEKAFYFQNTGLLTTEKSETKPAGPWADEGRSYKAMKIRFTIRSSIGITGYFAGPGTHILDNLALADPLLARLPLRNTQNWAIGHFSRDIPYGYIETIKKGKNSLKDNDLRLYYDKLSLLTRGNLISIKRFREIILFLLGLNTKILDRYLENYRSVELIGQPFDPDSHALPWIKRSLSYDLQGRVDSSTTIFLQMYDNNILLTEKDKNSWGWAMTHAYKPRFVQINNRALPLTQDDVLYQLRLLSFKSKADMISLLLRQVLSKPIPYEFSLQIAEVVRALDNADLIAGLANKTADEFEGIDSTEYLPINLAILCDLTGQPGAATDIYLAFAQKDIKLQGIHENWSRAMLKKAGDYQKLLGEQIDNEIYAGFFLRLFILRQDDKNLELLTQNLHRFHYSADGWKTLISVAETAHNQELTAHFQNAALAQYPDSAVFNAPAL